MITEIITLILLILNYVIINFILNLIPDDAIMFEFILFQILLMIFGVIDYLIIIEIYEKEKNGKKS